jgi:hypothetical protein
MLQLQRQVESRLVIPLKRKMHQFFAQRYAHIILSCFTCKHAYPMRISSVRLRLAAIVKFERKLKFVFLPNWNEKQSHQIPQKRRE